MLSSGRGHLPAIQWPKKCRKVTDRSTAGCQWLPEWFAVCFPAAGVCWAIEDRGHTPTDLYVKQHSSIIQSSINNL